MTDYSVWIYAMLAVGTLITAADVYTLSQPSDLPYLKKNSFLYRHLYGPGARVRPFVWIVRGCPLCLWLMNLIVFGIGKRHAICH